MIYLCKPGGNILGELTDVKIETVKLKQSLTNLWELTFEIDRYIERDGVIIETSYYEAISERMELLLIADDDTKTRFIIDALPTRNVSLDELQETKSITAHSIECDLQTKFVRKFKVNCGTSDSLEYLIFDDNGHNVNAYTYNPTTESRLAIDYIQVECRLDEIVQNYIDRISTELKEADFDRSNTVVGTWVAKQNTDAYKYLKSLLEDVPRIQKHLHYDGDSEILDCYVYTDTAGNIAIDDIVTLKTGLETLKAFYNIYKDKLSLIPLVLENASESGWSTWTDEISDELAKTKWNFDIEESNIYAFLTSNFANYAKALITWDRYNKKIGCKSIEDYNSNDYDTGVCVSMNNLINSVDISSSSEDGIKTCMYPTGNDNLGISYVNFQDRIYNFDYFVNKKIEGLDEYQFVNESLVNNYNTWQDYCYNTEITIDGVTYESRREAYSKLSKLYNEAMLNRDDVVNRLPNDGLSIDYNTYDYDTLVTSWTAYANAIEALVTLYKSDTGADKVYDTSGSIYKTYPIDDTLYENEEDKFIKDTVPEGIIPINETIYWYDYYSFYNNILPKLYESLKRFCATNPSNNNKYLAKINTTTNKPNYSSTLIITPGSLFGINNVYKYTLQVDGTSINKAVGTDEDVVKTVEDWIYQWELYGTRELETKINAWQSAAGLLYHDSFVESSKKYLVFTLKEEITTPSSIDDLNYTIQDSIPTDSWYYIECNTINKDKTYENLNDSQKSDYTNTTTNTSIGWKTSFKQWQNYMSYSPITNELTNRSSGFKSLGVIIQAQVYLKLRQDEADNYINKMSLYATKRGEIQKVCSYLTTEKLTDDDRAILNQLTSVVDYSNTNILTTNLDNVVTTIKHQEKLYIDAVEKLYELSRPQYSFSADIDNLFAIEEFKPMYDSVQLGNFIYMDTNLYKDDYVKLRLISIERNPLMKNEELTLEFSTMTKTLNGFSDFAFLLDSMNSGTSTSSSGSSSSSGGGTYGTNDADIQFSNNVLNALLSNNTIKTATTQAVLDTIKGNSATFNELISSTGFFDYLKVGNTAISGDCITTGVIKSSGTYINNDNNEKLPISQFDLNNGNFSYAKGKLAYDSEKDILSIASGVQIGSLSDYVTKVSLGTLGQTTINGGNINTGAIQCTINNEVYSKIDLADGSVNLGKGSLTYTTGGGLTVTGAIVANSLTLSNGLNVQNNCMIDGTTGKLTAVGCDISGTITASSLTLANGLKIGDNFDVNDKGSLTVNNAVIKNKITVMGSNNQTRDIMGNYNFKTEEYYHSGFNQSVTSETTNFYIGDLKNVDNSDSDYSNIAYLCFENTVLKSKTGGNILATYPSINYCGQHYFYGAVHFNSLILAKTIYLSGEITNSYSYNNVVSAIKPVGDTTSHSPKSLYVAYDGTFGYSSSSRRFKQDITYKVTDFNPHVLYNLQPAQYRYNAENGGGDDSPLCYGLIAEDVADVFPSAACYSSDGKNVDTWSEREMITPMLSLIQEQHEEIEQLKDEVKELKELVKQLLNTK